MLRVHSFVVLSGVLLAVPACAARGGVEVEAGNKQEGQAGARHEMQGGARHEMQGGTPHEMQGGTQHEMQGGTQHGMQGGTQHGMQGGTQHEMQGGAQHGMQGGTERQAAPETPGAMPAAGRVDRGDMASTTTGSVYIDPRIVMSCGILTAPHFAFESAKIEGDAATSLTAVARCFSTGALKGKTLVLVGHADPRGAATYNSDLGGARAASVRAFLRSAGVDVKRIMTASVGEGGATGTDEKGWARDRRVDLLLAD